MSARTGVAPQRMTMLTVEAKVMGVVMTSSPSLIAECQEGQVQAGGGGTEGDGVGSPHIGLESILETLDLGAGGDPAGFQGVNDLVDLVVVDCGGGEGEKFFAHCCLRKN